MILERIAVVTPLAYLIGMELLAQSNVLDPGVTSLVGNGVTIAVLAWYVVYDVRVRGPQILSTFTAEQLASRTQFQTALSAMHEAFRTEQSAARAAFLQEQTAYRAQKDAEMREYRDMLRDLMAQARHVQDQAQRGIAQTADRAQTAIMHADETLKKAQHQ